MVAVKLVSQSFKLAYFVMEMPPFNITEASRAGCINLVSNNFGRFLVLLKTNPNFAS